ncbi:MAG TPA: SpoIVB peptidase [Clostridia bacterium]|nr:SpoIVB peptidase [Clostridia bacterium]
MTQMQQRFRHLIGVSLAILVILLSFSPAARSYFQMPTTQRFTVGDELKLNLNFPDQFLQKISFYVQSEDGNKFLHQEKLTEQESIQYKHGWPIAVEPGKYNIDMKLFGLIPLKSVSIDVVPKVHVVPGGHSIGVLMRSKGVMVVGYSPIITENGEKKYPAKEAGIEIGDIIISINDEIVTTDGEAANLIDKLGAENKPMNLKIKRQEKYFTLTLNPQYCSETKRNRVGLYIRDSAAGVGTLTFYEPKSGMYGALGHIIADPETSNQIKLGEGRIINASIQGINQGERGRPGEKIGTFIDNTNLSGNIQKNTPLGIFGKLDVPIKNSYYPDLIPVAFANLVKEGPAEILTVVEDEKIEKFEIIIEKVNTQQRPDTKGLIIRITDPKLLEITGGIIQGMSGSPIIQNGQLVGAVTHVFVNDPTRGYGVLAEWMLIEAGISQYLETEVNKGAYAPFYFFVEFRKKR